MTTRVCAIIVTYNPDINILKKTINSTIVQVNKIFIIDNCSISKLQFLLPIKKNIDYTFLKKNIGIAAALNIGLKKAQSENYKYVILLDQDSILIKRTVSRFIEEMSILKKKDTAIAALGPRYIDPRSQSESRFVRYNWFRNSYYGSKNQNEIVRVDFLITSGSFYSLDVFNSVGLFDEDLFIDHVDTEWFLRARHLGYTAYGVWDVLIEHSLGDSSLSMWIFRRRVQPIHKPFRLYFISRNSLLIYRMKHSPLKWKTGDIMRLVRLFLIYAIFIPNRKLSILFFIKGLYDGVRGVTGPLK